MKILQVIDSMNPETGGTYQGVRNSIEDFQKIGVYNEVVCLDEPNKHFIDNQPFIIHALGPVKTGWHYTKKMIPWLINNLNRFDIVIVNGLWLFPGFATWFAIQELKKRKTMNIPQFMVMPHGMLDPYFQKAKGRKIKAIRNWIFWKLIEKRIINDADYLLFTSEIELTIARQTFKPYHPKKEINIGYGIQTPPTFTPKMEIDFLQKCPETIHESYLLFLSRIDKKKGINLLISAYDQIIKEQKSNEKRLPKLLIAGPGLDTFYGQNLLKEIANNVRLKNSIFFLGMLEGDAKWGALYCSEAMILPSNQENFGIVVAESLACGKPVLISNKVNIWKEIERSNSGFVEDNTVEGIYNLLKKWTNLDKSAKEFLSLNAKKCYIDNFMISTVNKRLINLKS